MLFALRWEWIDLTRQVVWIPADYRSRGNKGVPAALPLSKAAVRVLESLPRSLDGRVLPTTQNAVVCVWKKTLRAVTSTEPTLFPHDTPPSYAWMVAKGVSSPWFT